MLRYLGFGKRWFGDAPMPPHKRINWEFFAVIRGKCAPSLEAQPTPSPVSDTLWLFPPGYVHGWAGAARQTCEVLVLHFSAVPAAVEEAVEGHGCIAVRMSPEERKRLIRLVGELKPHYWRPVLTSDIRAERALMDLSLLILRNLPRGAPRPRSPHLARVLQAENWVRQHLEEKPSVVRVAVVVGISPSQLNRLFIRVRKESPKRVFEKLRIEKAVYLMSHSNAKLQSVAIECGYSNASNFCRAFRLAQGASPTIWRKEIYIQYRRPRLSEKTDYKRHGRSLAVDA
jgi:AraC family transcriptional regulator